MSDTQHAVASSVAPAGAASPGVKSAGTQQTSIKFWGLLIGVAALGAIIAMPQPAGLSVAGQHMLGIFAFAVIIWMTEAVEYAASSIMLMALMGFLLGFAPDPAHPERALGTGAALSVTIDGFTNPAVALIAASLVIAAAMAITGLDTSPRFQGDFVARHEPQPPAHRHHCRHGGARFFHSDRLRPCRLS